MIPSIRERRVREVIDRWSDYRLPACRPPTGMDAAHDRHRELGWPSRVLLTNRDRRLRDAALRTDATVRRVPGAGAALSGGTSPVRALLSHGVSAY